MGSSIQSQFERLLDLSVPPDGFPALSFYKIRSACQVTRDWRKSGGKSIPKVILQTAKDENIKKEWKESIPSYKQEMPGWHHVLMTDVDNLAFVKWFFPEFLRFYNDFPYPIMRADAIRYMWLFVIGGMYSDLDYLCVRDLSELFQTESMVYLVQSGNIHMITNSFMASKPGAEIWLEQIRLMVFRSNPKNRPWWFMTKHWVVMGTTGPMALQYAVDNYVGKDSYTMLPARLINPCTLCELEFGSPEPEPSPKGDYEVEVSYLEEKKKIRPYLKQLRGSSWHSDDSSLINKFFCNPRDMTLALGLILFLAVILIIVTYKCQGKSAAVLIGILMLIVVVGFLARNIQE